MTTCSDSPNKPSHDHHDDMNGLDSRISMRGYFERIIKEQAEALRIAEQEREKTAANIRRALEESMKAGDDRLTDHITHQIEQVQQALESLHAILGERDKRAADQTLSEQKQFDEFKDFVSDRFRQVNEFRGALDDLGKTMATAKEVMALEEKVMPMIDRNREDLNRLRGDIVGREAYDLSNKEIFAWRTGIDKWRNEMAGKGDGVSATTKAAMAAALFIATVLGIISFFLSLSTQSEVKQNSSRPYNQQQTVRP